MKPVIIGDATQQTLTVNGWSVDRINEEIIAVSHAEIGIVHLMREPRSHCEMVFRHFAEALYGALDERRDYKPWYDAVTDACVVAGELPWDESDARGSLAKLIAWHEEVALDPSVSARAAALAGSATGGAHE